MKTTAKLLALALCFAAVDASAQFQLDEMIMLGLSQTKVDYFQRMTRPYRDRTERFGGARIEALQMSLAIDDENDQLTLEGWGDNRADIRGGASRVKLEYGPLSGDTFTSGTPAVKDGTYPGTRAGAYGRFGTVEVEASRLEQKSEPLPTGAKETYTETGAGAGFSFGTGGVRLGFHGNFNKSEDSATDFTINRNAAGGALALKTGLFELGATADFVDRTLSVPGVDVKRAGPMLGGQALFKPFGGFKAGARVSFAKLSGDYTVAGTKVDMEGVNSEFGGRIEWAMRAVPLTLAAGLDRLYMDPEYKSGGGAVSGETGNTAKTLAAAFRPFGGRLLLGAEIKDLRMDYEKVTNGALTTKYGFDANSLAVGAEAWLLPGFALRASYRKLETQEDGDPDAQADCIAGGAGLKGKNFSFDASVRRVEEKADNNSGGDRFMEIRATYGYRF